MSEILGAVFMFTLFFLIGAFVNHLDWRKERRQPDEMYNKRWYYIKNKGITYISDEKLQILSQEFTNGEELLL